MTARAFYIRLTICLAFTVGFCLLLAKGPTP